MADQVWEQNGDLKREWGSPYGLEVLSGMVGGHAAFYDIVDDGIEPPREHRLDGSPNESLLDHIRRFKSARGRRTAVVVAAPYLARVRQEFGTDGEVNALIHAIAESHGLRVRVGHPADTFHLSRKEDGPTLPIVWWNPTRSAMPFPPVGDSNRLPV